MNAPSASAAEAATASPVAVARPARVAATIEHHLVDDARSLFGMARAGKSKSYEDRLSEQGYQVWDSREPERLLEWAADDELRWASLKGLTKLYRKSKVPQLREIARDDSAPDNLRLVAMIVVRINDDAVSDQPLIRWARESDDREMRMMALGALGASHTAAARSEVVRALDDEDLSLALVAVMAAGQQQNQDALPVLTEWLDLVLESKRWWEGPTAQVKELLVEALADIGGRKAAGAVAAALRKELARSTARPQEYPRFSTWSFERMTGMKWSAVGAQGRETRQREAREALEWWDSGGYQAKFGSAQGAAPPISRE